MRTKELFLMCILTVILISCSVPNNKSYKDVEFYSISNDSMLLKCKDLRGLAGFEIGKTTYSEALKTLTFMVTIIWTVLHLRSSHITDYHHHRLMITALLLSII